MIHCFHGLFGSPNMWKTIINEEEVIFHDLYDNFNIKKIDLNQNDILIGYSLGGRIALEIASLHHFNLNKLILISAHPGISHEQVEDREKWEKEIISKFKTETKEEFFKYWNKLPLFSRSKVDPDITDEIYKKSLKLFTDHLLSKQSNFWNELFQNKDKVYYLYGSDDLKYSQIALALKDHGIRTVPFEADHRVYCCEKELRLFLKKEIFL